MASSDDLKAYMGEHLRYELEMLCFSKAKLFNEDLQKRAEAGDEDAERTLFAMYESFVVHARNLDQFIRNKKDSTMRRANEYAECELSTAVSKLRNDEFFANLTNAQVFHMGKDRAGGKKVGVTYDHVAGAYAWLCGALTEFGAQLTADKSKFAESWEPLATILANHPPLDSKASIPKSATNYSSSVTTSNEQIRSITPGPSILASSGWKKKT